MNTLDAAGPQINAVVSASAGTGKTWLLIARLLRLLLQGEAPGSILAITFTEKAAAEILERLRDRLRQWTQIEDMELISALKEIGVHNPSDTIRSARLLYEQLLDAKEPIQIMTFHAFCAELLRRFPFESEAAVNFDILSETWELRKTAMKQLFAEAVRPRNKKLFDALQMISECSQGLNNTTKSLESFFNYHNDWRAFTKNETDPAANAAEKLRAAMDLNPDAPIIFPDSLHKLLTQHIGLLALHKTKDFQKRIERIQTCNDAKQFERATLENLMAAFFTTQHERRKNRSSRAFIEQLENNGHSFDQFTEQFETIADEIEKIKSQFLAKRSWHLNAAWYIAGDRLLTIYETLKKNQQVLDFSDLEWFANRLIQSQSAATIQYHLNQRIKHILIDEFQDTSTSQWRLILPLLEEMASQDNDGSIFIVGDIKQSIYGFRRANPQLQIEVAAWLQKNMNGKKYTLDLSYRSSPEIIKLVNDVFTSSLYQDQLNEFRTHQTKINTTGVVQRLPFFSNDKTDQNIDWRPILKDPQWAQKDNPPKCEATAVANKIAQLIDQQTLIDDPQNNLSSRPLCYGDIMILLRTRKNLAAFGEALARSGIPFISNSADKSLESLEVMDILALLSFLLDSNDNLSLAQVLRSPLFSATDDHLTTLAQYKEKNWFDTIQTLTSKDPLWERATRLFNRWIPLRDTIPIHDLLDIIYAEGMVIQRYRMSVPIEEVDLVEKKLSGLLNYALEFESGRYPNIHDFLQYIKNRAAYYASYSSQETAATATLPSGSNHVNIMTIHQAKGLEASVVFLADCGGAIRGSDTYNTLVTWPSDAPKPKDFLLLPTQKNLDTYTSNCLQQHKEREKREEVNLLYVAITRARQYLFVSGNAKDKAGGWYDVLQSHIPECELAPNATVKGKVTIATPEIVPAKTFAAPNLLTELNPSKLATFETTETAHGTKNSEQYGEVIHRALDLLTQNAAVPEQVQQRLAEEFAGVSAEKIHAWYQHAMELTQRTILRSLFDNSIYQQTFNELPISFIYQQQQFYGVIDRLCLNQDSVWLIDYKTHSHAANRMDNLKKHYHEQMRSYYIGLSLLYPQRKIRASLLLTDNATLVDYQFTQADKLKPITAV